MSELEKLKVVIEADASGVEKEAQKAKKSINSMNKPFKNPLKSFVESFRSANKEINKNPLKIDTSEIDKQIEEVQAHLENAKERWNAKDKMIQDLGITPEFAKGNASLEKLFMDLKEIESEISYLDGELQDLLERKSSAESGNTDSGVGETVSAFQRAKIAVMEFNRSIKDSIKSIPYVGKVATATAFVVKRVFSMMAFAGKKALDGIKKTGGAAFQLIKKNLIGSIPLLGRFTKESKNSSNALGMGFKNLLKYGLGIRSMFVLVNKLRSALVDGFKNLSRYSGTTNQSLSLLKSQLNQLKNSLATAFEPILNAVAPYLSKLIDYVLSATNALAQFFASLTGKSTYTVAKRVNTDFAAGLEGTANSADKVNDSAKKLKRTLLGFDEVNKLEDNSDSSSGGSGGGSSGSVSPGDMFTTETVNSQFANLADMVKDAWKNADFTEIGQMLGRKLNEALEKIPWDDIKETSRKIAKSIATFLNGFIDTTDWNLVGKTFAEGINTTIEFGYTFVTTFDWKKFGSAISDAVEGLVLNIDWAKAGKTFSEKWKGILLSFNTALEETDWNQIGYKFAEYFTNIDWSGLLSGAAKAIVNILISLLNFGEGFAKSITDGLKNVNWSKVANDAIELFKKAWELLGLVLELGVSLIKFGWTTVVDWVKGFIGGSISAAVNLTGNFIGDSWEKINNITKQLGEAAKKKLYSFKAKAEGDWDKLKGYTKSVVAKIKDKVANFTAKAKGSWDSIKEKAITLYQKVKDKAATYTAKSSGPWATISSNAKSVYDNVKSKTATFTAKASGAWDKISSVFSDAKKWLVNKAITWKVSIPHIKLPHLKFGTKTQTVLGQKVTLPTMSISWYASGGFPEEGPFYMNKGEIAGKFSNGKNVVANNQQITDGIAKAVGPAVYEATLAANRMNEGQRGNKGNIVVTLAGDAKQLFKVVKKEAENYADSTGLNPFPV